MTYLNMTRLLGRRLYALKCRNLVVGVWNPDTGGFIGVREKFGHRYLFTEYHYENGPPLGTAQATEDLNVDLPDDIRLDEHDGRGTLCRQCETPVEWTGPPIPAPWRHLNGDTSHVTAPTVFQNTPLYEWLEKQEAEYVAHLDV